VAGGSITGLGFNALAINASGQVAGAACGSSACQGLIWENGSVSSLPPLPAGYTGSVAFSINDIGQAAGISSVNGSYGATVWSNGTPTYIGNGIASSINNLGQVAGSMYLGPYTHGFVWQNGLLKDIGALSQSVEGSVALDINNSGSVVGYSGANAFIWNEEGMSDLNGLIDPLDPLRSLTWLRSASAINDAGQIVGYGVISGQTHAYMLTPNIQAVPEPESWILMLTGLVVISATIKRKSFTSC
jgi:probable HAF family extracellular repeat protein